MRMAKEHTSQSPGASPQAEREEAILSFWERERMFEQSVERRAKARRWVFYEGPPTANAPPALHHVLARVYKDIICRYKTMRGFLVERKAGWDTHGLPVELQVEKELGLKSKKDIERYGIAKFNAKCKEAVMAFTDLWVSNTKRIGFWLDTAHPYATFTTGYMESVWWIIQHISKRGLLEEDYKVVPYCPRCGTPLSSHEVAQGYEDVTEDSVYVKFKVRNPKSEIRSKSQATNLKTENPNRYLLAWTTTPWTLPGNVALAVKPDVAYVELKLTGETLNESVILAEAVWEQWSKAEKNPARTHLASAGGPNAKIEVVKRSTGKELVGWRYEPLFDSLAKAKPENIENAFQVLPADFVSTDEGTGIVHTAVMYGVDDFELGVKHRLPRHHTVDEAGRFTKDVPQWAGKFVKDVEPAIIADLKARGLLFAVQAVTHTYPFCWRCSTPLLYYAKHSWFIRMSKIVKDTVANNQKVTWVPAYLKEGRFGGWLKEAKDWALSRERYWGTPLPVWRCGECRHHLVIGSLADLDAYRLRKPNTYILMRHGEAESNRGGYISAWPEKTPNPLTPAGRKAVLAQIAKLKKKGISAIYASPLRRTHETAELIGHALGVPVKTDERLREINTGALNLRSEKEFSAFIHDDQFLEYVKRPDGGENLNDVKARMVAAWRGIDARHEGETILIVGHSDPLWAMAGALLGYSNEQSAKAWKELLLKPAACKEFRFHNWPFDETGEVNLHRPYVDEVELQCPKCAAKMRRVLDVIDVWFDSGAMPFAQGHWPFAQVQSAKCKVQNLGKLLFPADYICEAIDQTRGWFYTLLAISTLLKKGPPYKNVISLGHLLDAKGEKMSKSKGNVIDPNAMIERYGVDALRWHFYTMSSAGDPKRFDEKDLQERYRNFILRLANVLAFYETYAPRPAVRGAAPSATVLDSWMRARLAETTAIVTRKLDEYDITAAGRAVETLVDDLSNWYVRRSRRRFQRPVSERELTAVAEALRQTLRQVAALLAPFTPFLAEHIWLRVRGQGDSQSVHLSDWPRAGARNQNSNSKNQKDGQLLEAMAAVRAIAAEALRQRAEAKIKIRQPLQKFKVQSFDKLRIYPEPSRGAKFNTPELLELLKDEVNVKEVVVDSKLKVAVELDTHITEALREEGIVRELIRNIQDLRRDAGCKPQDRVLVWVSASGPQSAKTDQFVERWRATIEKESGLKDLMIGRDDKHAFAAERELELGGAKIWIAVRRP